MFGTLTNLTKAAVAVAVSPVALAVDIVTLPASAESVNRGAFDRTAKCFKQAGKALDAAVAPEVVK